MKRTPRTLLLLAPGLFIGLFALSGCATVDPEIVGAREHLRQGNFQQALEHTDRALAANPDNAEVYVLRGDIYRAMADDPARAAEQTANLERMAQAYRRAMELDPANRLVEVLLFQAYGHEMDRGAQAWQAAAEAQDEAAFLEAAQAYARAAAIMPDSANAHLFQGLALLAAREVSAAVEPLKRGIEIGTDMVEAYFYLGQVLLSEDRAHEAIAVLQRGVERFPDNVELQAELLNAYARTGQIEQALEAYAVVVAEHPDDAVLRYNFGSFLLQARRYDEAAVELRRAIELDPDHPEAHYNLGAAYLNHAIEVHERWAEMDHADPAAENVKRQRDELLERSIAPLERARALFVDEHHIQDACRGLFRAYALLLRDAEAREAAACAGIELD